MIRGFQFGVNRRQTVGEGVAVVTLRTVLHGASRNGCRHFIGLALRAALFPELCADAVRQFVAKRFYITLVKFFGVKIVG